MKLLSTIVLIMATGGHGWTALRRLASEGGPASATLDYFQLSTDGPAVTGCLIVTDSNPIADQKLILGKCGLPDQEWRLDSDYLYHTKLNDNMCMQAGRGGTPVHGNKTRIFPCNKNNTLQRFEGPSSANYTGGVRLKDYPTLCVSWRGVDANIGQDPIIVKNCTLLSGGWSQD
jgi:hypothetical protein